MLISLMECARNTIVIIKIRAVVHARGKKKLKIEISLNNMYVIWTSSIEVFSIHCASLTLNYFFSAQYTLISHYITRIIINEANFGV